MEERENLSSYDHPTNETKDGNPATQARDVLWLEETKLCHGIIEESVMVMWEINNGSGFQTIDIVQFLLSFEIYEILWHK